jgi:hypothetical protein
LRYLAALSKLLLGIEQAPAHQVGQVRLLGADSLQELACLSVEDRQLCWATTKPRLQTLGEAGQPTASGAPDSPADRDLREAVLERLVEVLAFMVRCLTDERARLLPFQTASAPASPSSYRYAATELLAALLARDPLFSRGTPPLPPIWLEVAGTVEVGFCFLLDTEEQAEAILAAVAGSPALSMTEASSLYQRARRMLKLSHLVNTEEPAWATLVKTGDKGWAAVATGSHLCLFRIGSPTEYGVLMSRIQALARLEASSALVPTIAS